MVTMKELLSKELNNIQISNRIEKIIFEVIFNHIKDLIFIMKVEEGPEFRYIFANEPGLNHASLSAGFIGKTLKEALSDKRALPLQAEYEKTLIKKETIAYSDEVKLSDGSTMVGESFLTPILDDQNQVRFVVSVTRDITHALIEKKRLIKEEQKYRSIVDHNLDGILSVNLKGSILEVNPAGNKILGYTEKQLSNRSIFNLIPELDIGEFKELFNKTKYGYPTESIDIRFVHRKGIYLTIHLKTVPIVIDSEIEGIYLIIKDLSQQAQSAEKIKYMAFHDQLTGLLNRRALLGDLGDYIAEAKKSGNTFALLSIDLDRFKYLNDTLGHLVGDEILVKVGERLSEFKLNNCSVYRQGGDEFIIILPNADRRKVSKFAQSILARFAHSFYLNSKEYYITPSIGVSMYPHDGNKAEILIKNADEALFRVKEKGKAHFQFYRSEMNSFITNIVELETNLRKAIDRNELTLHYQPQIELATKKIKSYEALLRWNNHELGNISPADFIPLAEDTGLIIPIGNWVIETACKQIKDWVDKGMEDFKVAINISPKQFQQHNLLLKIRYALEKYQIHPSFLEIEITEGAMQDTEDTIPILSELKELGISISVDDFGTGYSSLNYLKQFPIDVLKIDKSFVDDVLSNEKDAAITTTIIHMGRSLGMEVIAEGVENEEQAKFLLNANCHKAQGFLFARPLPAEEIEKKFL
ncbi:diguanylate cyclase (GGDEF)-like protein/PAS domain S-box-containing protein [Cytobacillus eiseniae]|uniref:Diguanylate cyclase (GGDEF)-like protein/PAS domain S-box-containing protein n=1 Tax=Cytobacillus eiseniae TaxID=762947 RepID=A0ABS4RDM5_9BACI|nr:EAL domain-containing protein [Cytobacillus eiseniae]MBP2239942.1 diguanylate cyclase (GGDEF)-like protein/PAS domain S-box-containing protein [Cytobacillus eiseniae]